MLYWYYYITAQFFNSKNDCRTKALSLYIGLWIMLIEAFMCFLLLFLIWCMGSIMLGLLVVKRWDDVDGDEEEDMMQGKFNNKFFKAARQRLASTNDLESQDCCIWYESLTPKQDVIILPCNQKHIFHAHCINEWANRSSTCPLCWNDISEVFGKANYSKSKMNYIRPGNGDLILMFDNESENDSIELRSLGAN